MVMRYTSRRRSNRRVHPAYQGAPPPRAKRSPQGQPIQVKEGQEPVVCKECGATVPMLKSGRPMGHAPGGFRTNTRVGRYRCEGSGTTK